MHDDDALFWIGFIFPAAVMVCMVLIAACLYAAPVANWHWEYRPATISGECSYNSLEGPGKGHTGYPYAPDDIKLSRCYVAT